MEEKDSYYHDYWQDGMEDWDPNLLSIDKLETKLVQTTVQAGCKILDVGCGSGRLTSLLDNTNNYHGIDISESAVAGCQKKGIKASVCDFGKPLPFKENSFDTVFIFEVMEHLFLPEKCLNEIIRVLSPGGTVIGSVPNIAFLPNRILMLFGMFNVGGSPATSLKKPWADPHIRFFTKSSLKKLIKSTGIHKTKIIGTMFSFRDLPIIYKHPKIAFFAHIISLPISFLGILFPRLFSARLYFKIKKEEQNA